MRGAIKQAAIDLILERCRGAGLPIANGALWPILEAAIKKDPVPALEALRIDRQEISESYKKQITQQTKPLGIKSIPLKPLGIDLNNSNKQTLSSVEFAHLQPQTIFQSANELTKLSRLKAAWLTQSKTEAEFSGDCMQMPQVVALNGESEDCVIRVKDENVHDLSAWDD